MPGKIKVHRWKPEGTAMQAVRGERAARRHLLERFLEADPAVQRYRAERAAHRLAISPALLEAKQEYEAHLATLKAGRKKTASGRSRGAAISVPTSQRKRILNAIDDAALSVRTRQVLR